MTRSLACALVLPGALVVASLLPRVALATPSLDACTGVLAWDPGKTSIDVLAPGTWCLDADIVVDHDASGFRMIVLHVDDITIDCRGHLLEYRGDADWGCSGPADRIETA